MTAPAEPAWGPSPGDHRRAEVTAVIGHGDDDFARAAHDVVRWAVTARVAGITIREPVEVVEVTDARDRVGFSYRALPGS